MAELSSSDVRERYADAARAAGTELPIACSLSAADYGARSDEISALASEALRAPEPIDGGVRFAFAPGAEDRLRRLVDAEAECCPFLTMHLRRTSDALELEVTGPAEAAPVIAEVFSAAPGRRSAR